MFKKAKLKSQINTLKNRIQEIENKRYRSQANLVSAILEQTEPNDDDVDYFNKYTADIEEIREELQKLQYELDNM